MEVIPSRKIPVWLPACVGAGVLIGAAGWWWMASRRSAPGVPAVGVTLTKADYDDLRREFYSTVQFAPVDQESGWYEKSVLAPILAGQTVGMTGSRVDPGPSRECREGLSRTLRDQILARASTTPDAYLDLADRDGARWIDPGSIEWGPIEARLKWITGRSEFDRSRPRDLFRSVLEYSWSNDGARVAQIGTGDMTGDGACFVAFARIRDKTEAERVPLSEILDSRAYRTLFGLPTNGGTRFRTSPRSPAEILGDSRETFLADVAMILRPERAPQYVFRSLWIWDPKQSRWHNLRMFRVGAGGVVMHY